jgi:hypothetical protein
MGADSLVGQRSRLVATAITVAALLAGLLTVASDPSFAGGATAAKKKKKCAAGLVKVKVKKKKKCLPPAGVRATLTWSNSSGAAVDLDLSVWDQFGNRNGAVPFGTIPDADGPFDSQTFGPEVFTDLLTPATRDFTIGACVSSDGGTDDTIAKLVFRPPDGSTVTVTSFAGQLANDHQFALLHLGSFNPGAAFCP